MPAHAIVAQPATLTGSIGVVMVKFAIGGSLEKLGVNIDRVTAGRWADLYAPGSSHAEERQRIEQSMQATYESFVEKAASGRNTTPEKIDAVARGRVWTGTPAKQIGLVDELGGLDRALLLAKRRAKIDEKAEVELVIYPQKKSFYELVQAPFAGEAKGCSSGSPACGTCARCRR